MYQGQWKDEGDGENKCVEVAVKMLKTESSDGERRALLQEASLMAQFKHPNILQMLGISRTGRVHYENVPCTCLCS